MSVLGAESSEAVETATYGYDAHGRLVSVTFNDGRVIRYTYDGAGNRLVLSRGNTTVPFSATLQITGAEPVNLRTLAEARGYTGVTNATIAFEIASGITIRGYGGFPFALPSAGGPGGIAIDTGVWPTGSYSISLSLLIKTGAKVYGGGGAGGQGSGNLVTESGRVGGAGGHAINCQAPISITVQSGGEVKAGGGGGGGGGGWRYDSGGDPIGYGGGGGGGGFPNGFGNSSATGAPPAGGNTGTMGSNSGGGSGGSGVSVPPPFGGLGQAAQEAMAEAQPWRAGQVQWHPAHRMQRINS